MSLDLIKAKTFASQELAPHASHFDDAQTLPPHIIKTLATHNWLAAAYHKDGTPHATALELGQLHEIIGSACTSTRSLLTVQSMVVDALVRWGTPPQKERWLAPLVQGHAIASLAITEPHTGDTQQIKTHTTPNLEGYTLTGRKAWISFAQIADLILVFTQQPQGSTAAFLVPTDTPGVTITPIKNLLGARASALAHIDFNNVKLPHTAKLPGGSLPGTNPIASRALQLGRYSVAWGCLGMMEACLQDTLNHTKQRKTSLQNPHLLNKNPLAQRLITHMVLGARATRSLCQRAASTLEARKPQATGDILVAKLFASTTLNRTAADALQLHGAQGHQHGPRVERFFRDARLMEIIEGPTQVLETLIARHIAPEHLP